MMELLLIFFFFFFFFCSKCWLHVLCYLTFSDTLFCRVMDAQIRTQLSWVWHNHRRRGGVKTAIAERAEVTGDSFVARYIFRIFATDRGKAHVLSRGGRRSLECDPAPAYFRRDLHRYAFRGKKNVAWRGGMYRVTATRGGGETLKYISPRVNCELIDISPQFRLRPYAILFRSCYDADGFCSASFFFLPCEFIPSLYSSKFFIF